MIMPGHGQNPCSSFPFTRGEIPSGFSKVLSQKTRSGRPNEEFDPLVCLDPCLERY